VFGDCASGYSLPLNQLFITENDAASDQRLLNRLFPLNS